jgi:hypothetical protein
MVISEIKIAKLNKNFSYDVIFVLKTCSKTYLDHLRNWEKDNIFLPLVFFHMFKVKRPFT